MFPSWVNDNETKFETMLTDDIDSLLSCALLKKFKGYEVNYFYDFDNLHEIYESSNMAIAVDASLTEGKCWDNHVTMLSQNDIVNEKSANLNNILKISRDNYYEKFCGSTALQIHSYYDIPLPESDEGKMALLAIDSGFLGHYSDRFREIHSNYLKVMGFPQLIELLENHTASEFQDIINKYRIKSKIQLNKNRLLNTNLDLAGLQGLFCLDLSLPNTPFLLRDQFSRDYPTNLLTTKIYTRDDFPEIFSSALIYKNKVAFTKI